MEDKSERIHLFIFSPCVFKGAAEQSLLDTELITS